MSKYRPRMIYGIDPSISGLLSGRCSSATLVNRVREKLNELLCVGQTRLDPLIFYSGETRLWNNLFLHSTKLIIHDFWKLNVSGFLYYLVNKGLRQPADLQTCKPAWQQAQISSTVGSRTLLFHQRTSLHTWGTISARQTRRACLLSIRMFLMRSGGWQRSDESGDKERQHSTSVESAGPPSGIECQHGTRWDPDTIHRIIMRFLLRDRRPKIKPEARESVGGSCLPYLTGVHLHNSLCNANIADKYQKKRRNVF